MATTYINFSPSIAAPFQFDVVLDGGSYNVVVTWNVFGARYYINIYDQNSQLVVCRAMVGSILGYNISLTGGYFATQLIWRIQNNQFEVIDI